MKSLPPVVSIDDTELKSEEALHTLTDDEEELSEKDLLPVSDGPEIPQLDKLPFMDDYDETNEDVDKIFGSLHKPLPKLPEETPLPIREVANNAAKNNVGMPTLMTATPSRFRGTQMLFVGIGVFIVLALASQLLTPSSVESQSALATTSPTDSVAEAGPIDDFAVVKGAVPDIQPDSIDMNSAPATLDNGYDKSKCENIKTQRDWLECNRAVYAGVRVEMHAQQRQIISLKETKAAQAKEIATLKSQQFSFSALPWWQRALLTFMLISSVMLFAGIFGWIRGLRKKSEDTTSDS